MSTPSPASRSRSRQIRILLLTVVTLCIALAILVFSPSAPPTPRPSNYAISSQAPFNQLDHYPMLQTLPEDLYRPTGDWIGRLILPTPAEFQHEAETNGIQDWVWFEVRHAPDPDWVGRILRLEWGDGSFAQTYPEWVTTDVRLGEAAERSQIKGDVVPIRLDGRDQVGPLQSLAGARPQNDVLVALSQPSTHLDRDQIPTLRTEVEPILVTGLYSALVQILEPIPTDQPTWVELCPDHPLCSREYFRVRHYDRRSGDFNGPEAIMRIPQQPADRNQVFPSTPHQITDSPAGAEGWYIYGAQAQDGIFTVQSLQPRSVIRVNPDEVILGNRAGLRYINQGNWSQTPDRKGEVGSVLVDPEANTSEAALSRWQPGDYGLVLHVFGGIGGEKAEPTIAGLIQGHFSFGLAEVIRDPFTGELIFEILYQQVYAHNPHAIIAGTHTWANYTGNLQRGWMGSRPISDVIIKLDVLTQDYVFETQTGDQILRVFPELLAQLQVMMARYRTGDGTGTATVTPATSCVQDSSQALYITIQEIRRQFNALPNIDDWIQSHPNSPQLGRMQRLGSLAQDLEDRLTPYGVVRSDWQQNAEALAGINNRGEFTHNSGLLEALLSWRSMLPRRAQDELSQIFLGYGAQLWFLRLNQVGGWDPTILPLAPTTVLEQVPLIAMPLERLGAAVGTPLRAQGWMIILGILATDMVIALPVGIKTGVLAWSSRGLTPLLILGDLLESGIGALISESLFRVTLIPHPIEGATSTAMWGWGLLSVLLFTLYAVLIRRVFQDPPRRECVSLSPWILMALLGTSCAFAYGITGSFLGIWCLHGIATFILALGHESPISPEQRSPPD